MTIATGAFRSKELRYRDGALDFANLCQILLVVMAQLVVHFCSLIVLLVENYGDNFSSYPGPFRGFQIWRFKS